MKVDSLNRTSLFDGLLSAFKFDQLLSPGFEPEQRWSRTIATGSMGFEVLKAENIKIRVFWDVTPYNLVNK
jgi:hypothetical protein